MRLFSKVKAGSQFLDNKQNSGKQTLSAIVEQNRAGPDPYEEQASLARSQAALPALGQQHYVLSLLCDGINCCIMTCSMQEQRVICMLASCKCPLFSVCAVQTLQQAQAVAVDAHSIVAQAAQLQQAAQLHIADVWVDGHLGNNEGLPNRKTRIYIPESMACQEAVGKQDTKACAADNMQPAKKKRKGKSERNRLKREAAGVTANIDN